MPMTIYDQNVNNNTWSGEGSRSRSMVTLLEAKKTLPRAVARSSLLFFLFKMRMVNYFSGEREQLRQMGTKSEKQTGCSSSQSSSSSSSSLSSLSPQRVKSRQAALHHNSHLHLHLHHDNDPHQSSVTPSESSDDLHLYDHQYHHRYQHISTRAQWPRLKAAMEGVLLEEGSAQEEPLRFDQNLWWRRWWRWSWWWRENSLVWSTFMTLKDIKLSSFESIEPMLLAQQCSETNIPTKCKSTGVWCWCNVNVKC